ncbi:MAG TPA: hypothetical protein VFA59_05970 [Vicinamibacterales bacterium]|nr:hypothetical protein [Vicinamibacterales bacterium]
MRKEIRRRRDAQVRANGVCTEHRDVFDVTPGGAKVRTALATQVTEVDRLLAFQQRCIEERRAATADIRRAHATIVQTARTIVRVGRLIDLPDAPMRTLQLPVRMAHDDLLAYARGLLDRVLPHADTFIAEGLPADALTQLTNAIARLTSARAAQATARQQFSGAFELIHEAQETATRTIAALEAIALSTADAPHELVTKLRIAKRVRPRSAVAAAGGPMSSTSGSAD